MYFINTVFLCYRDSYSDTPLTDPAIQHDPMLAANLLVSLHSNLQQQVITCDFVPCIPRKSRAVLDFLHAFNDKAR